MVVDEVTMIIEYTLYYIRSGHRETGVCVLTRGCCCCWSSAAPYVVVVSEKYARMCKTDRECVRRVFRTNSSFDSCTRRGRFGKCREE